jgi:replicative DNA helicase
VAAKIQGMTTTERQKAILGTLAINPNAYIEIADNVADYMFDEGILRKTAELVWAKQREGIKYDAATLEAVCPASELRLIIDSATSAKIAGDHAVQVRNAYFARKDSEYQNAMHAAILEGMDYFTARSQYLSSVEALHMGMAAKSTKLERLQSVTELATLAMESPNSLSGIPTPYAHINEFTGGWQKGDYNIIGARPGMGKTTYLAECALAAVQAQHPVAFFSMGDLTTEALYMKFACLMAGLRMKDVRTGNITKEQFDKFYHEIELLYDWPIEVIDLKDCDNRIGAISDRIRIGVEKDGWQMAMIDYVQQLRPDDSRLTGNQAYEQISQQIQKSAKSNDIPILAASQLSRSVEQRGGTKRPNMSDLRSSGAFEQDADGILFLYRPGYYGINEDEHGQSIKYRTEVLFEKYRIAGDEVPAVFNLEWRNQRLMQEMSDDDLPGSAPTTLITKTADTDEDLPF